MSLLGALVDIARDLRAEAPTPPPVAFSAPSRGGFMFEQGPGKSGQLDLTTSESTLFSVVDLLASTTAGQQWHAYRPGKPGQNVEEERPEVTGQQNLAVKLWNKPNSFMTGQFARYLGQWHYDSVGETWLVFDYWAPNMPRAWWPVRPDRMEPVPDADDYLAGYVYTGPTGEKVPLEMHEVLRITRPHPKDPLRGMSPVVTLLSALNTSLTAQQWIAAFFRNDATPGGIIEIEQGLEDHEFFKLRKRWNDQHRGVGRAHRVAILEYGKWKDRQFSMKDMQFTELRTLTRDQILEAYRVHKHMLGVSEDVNRANAYAADNTFATRLSVPRLNLWQELANGPYLELFGPAAAKVEFEYDSPVHEDGEEDRKDLDSKVSAAVALVERGASWTETLKAFGLPPIPRDVEVSEPPASGGGTDPAPDSPPRPDPAPDAPDTAQLIEAALGAQKIYLATEGNKFLKPVEARHWVAKLGAPIIPDDWTDPEPEPEPAPPVPPGPVSPPEPAPASPPTEGAPEARVRAALRNTPGPAGDVDLSTLDQQWQDAVEDALARWNADVLPAQYQALVEQVQAAVDSGDLDQLAELTAPDGGGVDILTAALVAMAAAGAAAVVDEAVRQGVTLSAVTPAERLLKLHAKTVASLAGQALAVSAGREALRLAGPETSAADVAAGVRAHLDALTDAQPRLFLGASLTVAVNQGRMMTLAEGPDADYYATEVLDSATCTPCRRKDGTKFASLGEAWESYPMGGFKDCLGMERCRGTVVAVWVESEDG